MKKLIILVLLLFSTNVYALTQEELQNQADKVKITITSSTNQDDLYHIITIENSTQNLLISVSEDAFNTEQTYKYNETNKGKIEIKQYYIYDNVNYIIRIYDNSNEKKLLRTIEQTTKKYNEANQSQYCQNNIDFSKCLPFYDGKESKEEIMSEVLLYEENKNLSTFDKIFIQVKKYYLYVLIPVVFFTIFTIIMVKVVKRGKDA